MQRLAAIFVILLAGLSLLVSTEAYQVARPVNPGVVPIVTTEQGALTLAVGSNNPYTMVTNVGGRLVLDMRKGPNGVNTFAFAPNSVHTLTKIIRVTNTTGSDKTVDVTASNTTPATLVTPVSGYIGASPVTLPVLLANNQSMEIDLSLKATATTGSSSGMTITVTGN